MNFILELWLRRNSLSGHYAIVLPSLLTYKLVLLFWLFWLLVLVVHVLSWGYTQSILNLISKLRVWQHRIIVQITLSLDRFIKILVILERWKSATIFYGIDHAPIPRVSHLSGLDISIRVFTTNFIHISVIDVCVIIAEVWITAESIKTILIVAIWLLVAHFLQF